VLHLNLPIAARTSEQVVPKIAGTSDGGCYVGWYDLVPNQPNPFSGVTRLELGGGAPGVAVRVMDASRRRVRSLIADGAGTIRWDGTDDSGARLPGGVCFYGLIGASDAGGMQRAVLVC
jgi:hypothetical protein